MCTEKVHHSSVPFSNPRFRVKPVLGWLRPPSESWPFLPLSSDLVFPGGKTLSPALNLFGSTGSDPRQHLHPRSATLQPHTGPEASSLENGELGESLMFSPPPLSSPRHRVREFNLPSPTARLMLEPQAPQGSTASAAPVQGWTLTCQQLRALLHKRLLLARRSHRGLFAQVTKPCLYYRGHANVLGVCRPSWLCTRELHFLINPFLLFVEGAGKPRERAQGRMCGGGR